MNYIEYKFSNSSSTETAEILTAFLDRLGYSGFIETEEGLLAYLPEQEKDEDELNELLKSIELSDITFEYTSRVIPDINWNARWESDFKPVEVDSSVRVHAAFHPANPEFLYNIVINPKMSFGTGHHQTTRLMIRALLDSDVGGKDVLDMGTGTGVLAILASMMGANKIIAVDIDKWAFENSRENFHENRCKNISSILGDADAVKNMKFDLILANINRNVLLNDLKVYVEVIKNNGLVIISGILKQDMNIIGGKIQECGLNFIQLYEEDEWIALRLSINK